MSILLNLYAIFKGNRVYAGNLGDDMVFRKTVEVRDKLQLFNAFGLDVQYMDDLFHMGTKTIEITVTDAGRVYTIDVSMFRQNSVIRKIGNFGRRYYCSLEYWTEQPSITKKGARKDGKRQ